MSEPRRISGNGSTRSQGKSFDMIRAQMGRIQDAFRDAYYEAEQGNRGDMDTELARLNRRLSGVNQVARRYEANIESQPEYERISQILRRTYREGGRSPEEARETARRLNELRQQRNSIRFPRSVYMRNNRRG